MSTWTGERHCQRSQRPGPKGSGALPLIRGPPPWSHEFWWCLACSLTIGERCPSAHLWTTPRFSIPVGPNTATPHRGVAPLHTCVGRSPLLIGCARGVFFVHPPNVRTATLPSSRTAQEMGGGHGSYRATLLSEPVNPRAPRLDITRGGGGPRPLVTTGTGDILPETPYLVTMFLGFALSHCGPLVFL